MIKKAILINLTFVLFLGLCGFDVVAKPGFVDMEIIRSDDSGISVVYRPLPAKLIPSGSDEVRLYVPHHYISGKPGEYPVSARRHLVVIPSGSNVSLQVTSLKTNTVQNVHLSKIQGNEQSDIEDTNNYDSIDNFITISKPFRYRRNQVVEVILKPTKYDHLSRTFTYVEDVKFSLTFNGGQTTGYRFNDKLKLDNAILNPEKISEWALPPQRNISSSWPPSNMVKIIINEEGIYKVTRSSLTSLNLNLPDFPMSLMKFYNNGGRALSHSIPDGTELDSLIENAVYVHDADGDDIFDSEDYILFYGFGTDGWNLEAPGEFEHYINPYTYNNIYWLELNTSGSPGKRMTGFGSLGSASTQVTNTKARIYLEEEQIIYSYSEFPGSGLNWYGDFFNGPSSRIYSHYFNGVASGYYKVKVKFKSISGTSKVKLYLNNQEIAFFNVSSVPAEFTGEGILNEGVNTLKIENLENTSMYLDWYEIEYSKHLQSNAGILKFESPVGSGTALYGPIAGLSSNDFIFKISQFEDVQYVRNNQFVDNLSSSYTERYLAYSESAFQSPVNMSMYSPPAGDFLDLRNNSNAVDYLLITHSDFYNALEPLVNFWSSEEGLNVKRVDISQIFDQFSWGLYDPTAIRDFFRYAIDNWANPPAYALLVGDGDYDYKNIIYDDDKNWIPPFEQGTSCYDDFYASVHAPNNPEVVLGRLTVTSAQETQNAVDKVIKYVGDPEFGSWRTSFTLVADDEYKGGGSTPYSEHAHTEDSETIATEILPQYINVNKIYLTEYPILPGVGGRKKPQAGADLLDIINRGTAMINYYGHGNEYVWADEQVFLYERDFPQINNGDRLSIFVAATCDWAYFDNPERQSFPEELLTVPGKGAIVSVAATRFTYSSGNSQLAENMYGIIFQDQSEVPTIGEALLNAKLCCTNMSNARSYHVIGDPMVRPCFPTNKAEITSVDPDSLFAVNLTTASGDVYMGDEIWNDFEGTVYLEAYDAANEIEYVFAGSSTAINYEIPGNRIFRGPVDASGGNFNIDFVVPLDITYGGDLGRLSVYFNDNENDGCGYLGNLYIGAGGNEMVDSDIPQGEIFFGDRSYRQGDPVSTSPLIIADLSDSSGINLGAAAGHEISLIIDDNLEFDLTDYFEYNLNSYQEGVLETQLDYLPPGVHNMKFRIFDSFNHPNQIEFTIETVESNPNDDYLYGLLNYPNPFKDETAFVFHLLQDAEVEIEIYTVAGRKIKNLPPRYCQNGYVFDRFNWDGRDEQGDRIANGVYLYKVIADFNGESVSKIGRLIYMR